MNDKHNFVNTKELTIVILLYTLCLIMSFVMIMFSMQTMLYLSSIPIIICGIKCKSKYQFIGLIGVTILLSMTGLINSILFLCTAGILGIVQGYLFSRKKATSVIVFLGTVALFFGGIIQLYLFQLIFDINIISDMKDGINLGVSTASKIIGTFNLENTVVSKSFFRDLKQIMIMLIPITLLLSSLIFSLINTLVTRAILCRINLSVNQTTFKDFRINSKGRLVLLSITFTIIFFSFIDKSNSLIYMINYFFTFYLLMLVNGFTLIWFITEKKSNVILIRIGLVTVFLIAPLLGVLIGSIVRFAYVIIGFLDIFFDFRKINFTTKPK